jgi:pyruvate dehydrogenase E2 component (dihydrolipoamide acetyltransferase)
LEQRAVIEIKMPRLSDTMEEGAINTWHKRPGDKVEVGDVLVEIETDKAVMEYEAYQAGTLSKILVEDGQTVDIGAVIALLDDGKSAPVSGTAPAASAPAAATGTGPSATAAAPAQPTGPTVPRPAAPGPQAANGRAGHGEARQIASPLVRKIARESQLDLSDVTGTGPGGRIIRADISGLLAGGTPAPAPAYAAPGSAPVPPVPAKPGVPVTDDLRGSRSVPVSQVRRVIARRLSASAREIPHFYVTAVADAEELMNLRSTLNAQLAQAGRAKVSVNDLLIRACALALRANPEVNVSYGGDDATAMLLHDRVNIGVAVAADSGLIVPVIRDADTKTVTQLGAESRQLAALAAERKLTPDQTSGGTFTISNLGMFGVEQFTAIINPPESAILAVGATTREPAVVGDTIEPRYRLRYTLSADHRVVDGALAAKFLKTLSELIEHPWMIVA